MKKVFALIACTVIGITSASALEFGVGGTVGARWPAGIVGSAYGGVYEYNNFDIGKFAVGVDVGYLSRVEGILFVGVYGQYNFTFSGAPGLSLYPKLGADFALLLTDFGVDAYGGVGVSYNFENLIGFGLVARAEVLFDAYIGFLGTVNFGPRVNIGVGYKLF
jgi:hypothetical protein